MTSDNNPALEMLSKALEIEKKGQAYYEKASKSCKNEYGKKIFEMLRDDEVIHETRIKSIYKNLESGEGWNEKWAELKTSGGDLEKLFGDIAAKHSEARPYDAGDIEALDMGAELEQATVKFYEEYLKRAKDQLEKGFLKAMVAEEKGHRKALLDMSYYLKDPEGFFMEREKAGLDGA